MAKRTDLSQYQRDLLASLNSLTVHAPVTNKLGFQLGSENWLVDLDSVSEVLPLPPVTPVPLTKTWFVGATNVRGTLYGVVDLAAFLGGSSVSATRESRILLINERHIAGSALLVTRMAGLKNPAQFVDRNESNYDSPWVKAVCLDASGGVWKEVNVGLLVQHASYLEVGI